MSNSVHTPLAGVRFAVVGQSEYTELLRGVLTDLGIDVVSATEDATDPAAVLIADRLDADPAAHAAWVQDVATSGRAAVVTLTPFGLTGPRSHWRITEAVLQAASGLSAYCIDAETAQPRSLPGTPAGGSVAVATALAALHAWDLSAQSDEPVHLDVSAQEAATAQGPFLETMHFLMRAPGLPGAGRLGPPAGAYDCLDGKLLVLAVEPHQRVSLQRAIVGDEPAEPMDGDELAGLIRAWCAARPRDEAEAYLQDGGVPAAAIRAAEEAAADYRASHDTPPRPVLVPRRGRATAAATPRRRASLSEKKVLVAGAVIAVPLAGALLAALGAKVLRVEAPDRLDMYRRIGPFIDGVPGDERSAYFTGANYGVRSALADPVAEADYVQGLVREADVVLENLGARVAKKWGVDAPTLSAEGYAGLAVSSSGYGGSGIRSGYKAYAYNIHAYAGYCYDHDGRLVMVRNAMADMATSYLIALLAAAWALAPEQQPAHVDVAMADIMAARLGSGADAGASAMWATRDGGYIVVSVADTAALEAQLGTDPAAAAAQRDAAALVEQLQNAGIPAAEVADAQRLLADAHLAERGFLAPVTHPADDAARVIALPWLVVGKGREALGGIAAMGSSRGWSDD